MRIEYIPVKVPDPGNPWQPGIGFLGIMVPDPEETAAALERCRQAWYEQTAEQRLEAVQRYLARQYGSQPGTGV